MFQRRFKDVSMEFQVCFKEVLRVFTESSKGGSKEFIRCFNKVSRVIQGIFRECHGGFKKILRVFQVRWKEV